MTKNPRDHRAWSNAEIEEDAVGYTQARHAFEADQDQARAQREEEERFERFKQAFTRTGGAPSDARSVYAEHKRQQAAEAARDADAVGRGVHAANVRAVL